MRDGTREQNLSDDLLSFDTTLPTSCPGLSAGRTLKEMMFRMSKQLRYIIILLFIVVIAAAQTANAQPQYLWSWPKKLLKTWPKGRIQVIRHQSLLRPAFPWTAAAISPASAKSVVQISPSLVSMRTRLPRCKQPSDAGCTTAPSNSCSNCPTPTGAPAPNPQCLWVVAWRITDYQLSDDCCRTRIQIYQPYPAALRVNGAHYVTITSA